jgi:inosose dehydratase
MGVRHLDDAMIKTIRIGNAPCSWGTLEFEGLEGETIEYSQMLDELAETGYEGTELGDWGFMPTDSESLERELKRRDLTLLGAFVPVELRRSEAHAPGLGGVLKTAKLLAQVYQLRNAGTPPFLVLSDENGTDLRRTKNAGRITPEMALTPAELKTFAGGANGIAERVMSETGLRTVFHHHCSGFIETPDEIERLLESTDDKLLGLVFDTGHYAFGSGQCDPEVVTRGLNRFAERIWYVHFKDCHPEIARKSRQAGWDYFEAVKQGVFCELGKGCVDFEAVKGWLESRHYSGWALVEQDVLPGMGSPRESARRNLEYLRAIGF